MNSWRDEATEEVQEDLDRLLDVTIEAARHFLDVNGEFIPFPMVIKSDGELAAIGLEQPETPSVPDSAQVIAGLVGLFRERKGSIRALAIGSDVQIPSEAQDAIEVRLEHRDGPAITVLLPYQIDPLDDTYLYDEPRAQADEHRIWR
ncbi:MAG TPA: hypothetical protein VHX87_05840 [Galbitalea sp.]|jgi:hypothetical protein|nr:hypothetical protein [Galbitalea sp.]